MTVYETIKKRRTIRKFSKTPLTNKDIMQIIDCARLAPYAANLQPLKFKIVTDEEIRLRVYPHIVYAGYLGDWNPNFDETPSAFIVVLNDTTIKATKNSEVDCGAAIASMCFAATELGIDSCWIGSANRVALKEILKIPEHLDITYILGLGYGEQSVKVVDMIENDPKYVLDSKGNIIVPKRTLQEIII